MEHASAHPNRKKRNVFVSYIKGLAMFGIVLVHLINWSNLSLPWGALLAKEVLHTGLFLFVLTTGSVVFIAYAHRPSLWKSSIRFFYRALQLLFVYYLYNIAKFLVFDFSTQPFYLQFIERGTFSISGILAFKSFSVPITILPTYSILLFLAPLLLLFHKRIPYAKIWMLLLAAGIFAMNYASPMPSFDHPFIAFLYAHGYSIVSVALWIFPFILGFFLAQTGFEKNTFRILIGSGVLTLAYGISFFARQESFFPSDYQFPLGPYLMTFSLFIFSVLVYLFRFLETRSENVVKHILLIVRYVGNHTLFVYVFHWIVIDITVWIFSPHVWVIWISVPATLAFYVLFRRSGVADIGQNG